MLDPYLHHELPDDKDVDVVFTYVSTGSGGKLGVGSEIAKHTRTSFLFYHWTPGGEGIRGGGLSSHESQLLCWDAKAAAAHRNLILLRFLFPTNTGTFPDKSEEFFVYQPPPRRTLVKLPTCRRHKLMSCDTNTGILCRENGEFVVAHLSVIPGGRDCQVTAELCCLFGHKGSWCTSKIFPICREKADEKLLNWWETDAVVSFGDFICWVDYLRGILLCDVFSPSPKVKYIPLPIKPYRGRCNPDLHLRGNLAAHRSVCVTSRGGGIKFVDVAPSHSWLCGREHEYYEDSEDEDEISMLPSAVSSWTLVGESWVKDDVMTPEEIFGITSKLPGYLLECPLVDLIDPDTIYFTTGELGDSPSHLIAVNMKTRTITRSFGSYSNKSCNLRFHEPFLPWMDVNR
jgi:hypothetical protein